MKAVIQAMAAAGAERSQSMGPILRRPAMKQPKFNWEAEDKCNKLKNFGLEVKNVLKTDTLQTE